MLECMVSAAQIFSGFTIPFILVAGYFLAKRNLKIVNQAHLLEQTRDCTLLLNAFGQAFKAQMKKLGTEETDHIIEGMIVTGVLKHFENRFLFRFPEDENKFFKSITMDLLESPFIWSDSGVEGSKWKMGPYQFMNGMKMHFDEILLSRIKD